MTTSEFKAWFEGYTENISKIPTQKQWARIKVRVGDLAKGDDQTTVVYRDGYHDHPSRPWWPQWTWMGTSMGGNYTLSSVWSDMKYNAATNYLDASDGTAPEGFMLAMAHDIGCDEAAADVA